MADILQHLQQRINKIGNSTGGFVRGLHLRHRGRGLLRHLKRGRHGIGAVAMMVIAWTFPLVWTTTPDAHMRWMGAILQIAGVGTVAYGLGKTRELFDVPSVWRSILGWFRDIPSAMSGPQHVSATMNLTLPSLMSSASAEARGPTLDDAILEERVAELEKEYERIRKRVRVLDKKLDEEAEELKRKLDSEESARKEADAKIKQQIKEVSIGGLHLEVIGLVWLVVGIFVATVPKLAGALLSWG